ncbi:MAG TPA: hypothetical protein VJ965_01010 [Anaerolineales bacterium]|nr:hypothetical protein [Anaerolineales bacterium]
MMEKDAVQKVSKRVYRQFPEMQGTRPKVKQSKMAAKDENYILTFNTTAKGPGGRAIPRFVRVVANAKGKIIRISTSR